MNRRGHKGRVDQNHREIVEALRKTGVLVLSLASLGDGAPDILCYSRGRLTLLEVKAGKGAGLTDDQRVFHRLGWPVAVVRSAEDAIQRVQQG